MQRTLKVDELHLITKKLLDIKSNKNEYKLLDIHNFLLPSRSVSNYSKAFVNLIKLLHPDKFEFHKKQLELSSDISFYTNLFSLIDELSNKVVKEYALEVNIDYGYDVDDFDDLVDIASDYNDIEDFFEDHKTCDLIDAFKIVFIGNDIHTVITPSMISMTTGYVDFSNLNINDINGIEYFIHIERLNLNKNKLVTLNGIENIYQLKELYISQNQLDDIEELVQLKSIEIIDISNNDISDFTPLLKLESLKYVNLSNNNSNSRVIKRELENKGIIVIG